MNPVVIIAEVFEWLSDHPSPNKLRNKHKKHFFFNHFEMSFDSEAIRELFFFFFFFGIIILFSIY